MKMCRDCKTEKPLTDFSHSKSGYQSYCKPCMVIRSKKYYATKGERDRFNIRKERELRQGICDLCGEKSETMLVLDHCHWTKKIRGLICIDCNLGLGRFYDSVRYLQRAIEYLNRSEFVYIGEKPKKELWAQKQLNY